MAAVVGRVWLNRLAPPCAVDGGHSIGHCVIFAPRRGSHEDATGRLSDLKRRLRMKRVCLAVLLMTFAFSSAAMAESVCHSIAIGKNDKPLAGAALNSFMAKCARETCEPKAIGKDGKPLAGAAKSSFMKKCRSEA
jgi:hypothetical protein